MDLVYFGSSGESVLVLDIRLGVSSEGVSGLLEFFIFNSDSGLIKNLEVRVMGKYHMFF